MGLLIGSSITQFKHGQKTWTDTAPNRICRWPVYIRKNAQCHLSSESCKLKPQWHITSYMLDGNPHDGPSTSQYHRDRCLGSGNSLRCQGNGKGSCEVGPMGGVSGGDCWVKTLGLNDTHEHWGGCHQNIRTNKITGENEKCVFYFTEKNITDLLANPGRTIYWNYHRGHKFIHHLPKFSPAPTLLLYLFHFKFLNITPAESCTYVRPLKKTHSVKLLLSRLHAPSPGWDRLKTPVGPGHLRAHTLQQKWGRWDTGPLLRRVGRFP